MAYRVSKERFGELVEAALGEVPEPFAKHLEEVSIEIRDLPTGREARLAGAEKDSLLLGLYHGRPRTHRNVMDDLVMPDVIYLFQRNIERVCDSERELIKQVHTTVLHEIGHHFGMSEEDLDELGYG